MFTFVLCAQHFLGMKSAIVSKADSVTLYSYYLSYKKRETKESQICNALAGCLDKYDGDSGYSREGT